MTLARRLGRDGSEVELYLEREAVYCGMLDMLVMHAARMPAGGPP